MEKITIQAIDCYRHDYWKVSLDLLKELNIIEAISDYSYLGNGSESLNEKGFAYLEIDSDCGTFDKAMKFYKKEYSLDLDTLTEAFNDNFEDYQDWLDELDDWDTNTLDESGHIWFQVPEDLAEVLKDKNQEDEDDE